MEFQTKNLRFRTRLRFRVGLRFRMGLRLPVGLRSSFLGPSFSLSSVPYTSLGVVDLSYTAFN